MTTKGHRRAARILSDMQPSRRRLADVAEAILPVARRQAAQQQISSWEGYVPTALAALPGLASRIGVGQVWCKDEGSRFGLGSFKALGGAYAVREQIERGKSKLTVACATEGNHGRSVAWAAQRFGAECIIYLHERVSAAREKAIADYGAVIKRVPGGYDDAVRLCADDAGREGWTVISDTSWTGYEEIPRSVMAGYTVMTREIVRQLAGQPAPTHVFLQGGVGGLAAAVLADLGSEYPLDATRYILVEPLDAACLMSSLQANKPVRIDGPMKTVMAGLACGEPSPIALEIVAAGADAAVALDDDSVVEAMHLFAAGAQGDRPIVSGASGAAGLAGLLVLMQETEVRRAASLDGQSRVLLINTERDTDPEAYARLMASA